MKMISRIIPIMLVMLLVIGLGSCAQTDQKPENSSVVVRLSGTPVSEAFFQKAMIIQANNVRIEFNQKHGVVIGAESEWGEEYDGVSPLSELKTAAMEEVKRLQAILLIAKERGIIKTADYDDLIERSASDVAGVFDKKVSEDEIASLPIYENDAFLKIMEITKHLLVKSVRDDINQKDIEGYVSSNDIDELSKYIRISPEEENDRSLLAANIVSNEQRFSVIKDVIQDEKCSELIDEKIRSFDVKINEEVYKEITFIL